MCSTARNWWEKSESRGVSGLEDCSSPCKTGRQNQILIRISGNTLDICTSVEVGDGEEKNIKNKERTKMIKAQIFWEQDFRYF